MNVNAEHLLTTTVKCLTVLKRIIVPAIMCSCNKVYFQTNRRCVDKLSIKYYANPKQNNPTNTYNVKMKKVVSSYNQHAKNYIIRPSCSYKHVKPLDTSISLNHSLPAPRRLRSPVLHPPLGRPPEIR